MRSSAALAVLLGLACAACGAGAALRSSADAEEKARVAEELESMKSDAFGGPVLLEVARRHASPGPHFESPMEAVTHFVGLVRKELEGTHREERTDYQQKASFCKRRKERLNVDGLTEHKRAQEQCHSERSARVERTERALRQARRARDQLERKLEAEEAELQQMDKAGNDVGAHFASRKREHVRVLDALSRIVEILGIPHAVDEASESVQPRPLQGSPKEELVSLLQTAEPSTGPRLTMQGEIERELARLHEEEDEVEKQSDEEAQRKLAQAMANAGVARGDDASSSPASASGEAVETAVTSATGAIAPQEGTGEATAEATEATGAIAPQEAGSGLMNHPPVRPSSMAKRTNRKQRARVPQGAIAPEPGMATGPARAVSSLEDQVSEDAAAAVHDVGQEQKQKQEQEQEQEQESATGSTGATGTTSAPAPAPKRTPIRRSDVEHLASLLAALRSSLHASLQDYRHGLKAAHEEWQAVYDTKRRHVLDLERQLRERETNVHHRRHEHNQSHRARDTCFKGREQLLADLQAAREAWDATHEECTAHQDRFETNAARHEQNMRLLGRLEKMIRSKLTSMGTYLEEMLDAPAATGATGATGTSEPAPKKAAPKKAALTSASGHNSGGDDGPHSAPKPEPEPKVEKPAATAATGPSRPRRHREHKPAPKRERKTPSPDVAEAKRRGKSAAAAILRGLDKELADAAKEGPEEEEETFRPRTIRSVTAASGATGLEGIQGIEGIGAAASGDAPTDESEFQGGHFDAAAGFGDLDFDQHRAGMTTKCDREPGSPECRGRDV